MIKNYNIALLPVSKKNDIINHAKHFSAIADHYQLGHHSIPHITLCKLQIDEDKIKRVWSNLCLLIPQKKINLNFKKISYISFDYVTFWISLIPVEQYALKKMYKIIANTWSCCGSKAYDPHMTLINTKYTDYTNIGKEFEKLYAPIKDDFVLSLGETDSIGQFSKIIYQWKEL